nr:hypothetical protein [Tanacetum cinerariifolium]
MVDDDDETDKEIDKLMALISLSFKKIYKPTNNNLRTSSNTSRANQDNSPRIHRNAGYESQRSGNVAGARDTIDSSMEEAGIQLNAEQVDWKDDTDDESDDQELEAHYMYMAKIQEVSPDAVDTGPIFEKEPEQKDAHNVLIESEDMNYDSEQIDQNDEDADLAEEPTLTATIPVNDDQFIEVGAQLELYRGAVRDVIFCQRYRFRSLEHEQERTVVTFRALWRPVLALEAWAGRVDTHMTNMSWAGYDDHRLVHDMLLQHTALQREL